VDGLKPEIPIGEAMKSISTALLDHINALRANRDAPAIIAECFTITLTSGLILTYTSADVPITMNGYTFVVNSLLIDGLQYKSAIGLDVDSQQITISARVSDTIGGIPFLHAIRNGLLDGATIKRERAFLSSWDAAPIGSVVLFSGRVATVDNVGRTTATVTVNSELTLLDLNMPRNLYQPHCNHVLYDSGCGLSKAGHGASGTAESGSTTSYVAWASSLAAYEQGSVTFTSGSNTGVSVTVKNADTSGFGLAYPLPAAPAVGDAFTIYQGCDHTLDTCKSRFGNGANFRGFPFVPVPDTAY